MQTHQSASTGIRPDPALRHPAFEQVCACSHYRARLAEIDTPSHHLMMWRVRPRIPLLHSPTTISRGIATCGGRPKITSTPPDIADTPP